jgi:hypothetical protein
MIAISHVPIALVLSHASATPHLALAGLSTAHAELILRLDQPASAAPSLIGPDSLINEVRKQRLSDRNPHEGLLLIVDAEFPGGLP